MTTIVTRSGKGLALTHAEGDANFTNLNTDKVESDDVRTFTNKSIDLASNTVTGTKAEFDTALSDDNFAFAGVLASNANGEGASLIGIEDTAGNFTATTVEGALAEIYSDFGSTATGLGASLVGLDLTNQTVEAGVSQQVAGVTSLRGIAPVASRSVYLKYHTTAGDGGHGEFRAVTGAAPGTYVDNGGTIIVPTGGDGSAAWLRDYSGLVNARWFGASPSASSSVNTTAIQAAVNISPAFVPAGTYQVNQITIGSGKSLSGDGASTVLSADNITGAAILIGSNVRSTSGIHYRNRLSNLSIIGTATEGVRLKGALLSSVSDVYLSGLTATNGFVFDYTWGSSFSNLWTNGSTISGNCFVCGQDFNANTCENWYTSNYSSVSILVDGSFESGTGVALGSSWTNMTVQGGAIGLYVRSAVSSAFSGVYSENCVKHLQFGDAVSTKAAKSCTVSGLFTNGPGASNPAYADRTCVVDFNYALGCKVIDPYLSGAHNAALFARVTFSGGGGSGAIAVARVTAGGTVHSIDVLYGGSGYTSAPTVSITGSGSGATATSAITGDAVTSCTVTAVGSGYTPTACPVAISYRYALKCSVENPFFSDGLNSDRSPVYPWVVRHASATSDSGVAIINDMSLMNSSNGNGSANLVRSQGFAYRHFVTELSSSGALVSNEYIPVAFP